MENLPNEIVLQILGYLNIGELIQCASVSKRLKTMCKDKSLSYGSNMLAMKDLTVNDRKSIIDYLIARPEIREVRISWLYCPIARSSTCVGWKLVRNQTMPKIVTYYD
mgnify:FL=1